MDNQFLNIEPKKDTGMTPQRHIEPGVISRAIYMVTDLFDASEPLKVALRTSAVGLLTGGDSTHILRLKDTLKLTATIGLISETNIQILLEAIDHIKPYKATDGQIIYIEDMFKKEVSTEPSDVFKGEVSSGYVVNKDDPFKHIDTNVRQEVAGGVYTKPAERDSKPTQPTYIEQEVQKPTIQKPGITTVTALDIGARRKKILEVVKSKGQATIHEFIQSIQGCSSKTIQRELTSLVLSGTLKKTGERRWSKYSMR